MRKEDMARSCVSAILAVVFALWVQTPVAVAWETFSEFESLTEAEPLKFEGPADLGSEYQSDELSYQSAEIWRTKLWTQPVYLDGSIGSTGPKNFLISDHLRVSKRLLAPLEFRFTQFSERTQERDSAHQILELLLQVNSCWRIGLYGQPSLYKRENDMGVTVLQGKLDEGEHRAFLTWVDFTRADRNDRPDFFRTPYEPLSYGLVGRRHWTSAAGRKSFWEYALRHESFVRWYFPQTLVTYEYMKSLASGYLYEGLTSDWDFSVRLQADSKVEANQPDLGSSQVADSWVTERLLGQLRIFHILRSFPISEVSAEYEMLGVQVVSRQWKTPTGTARYLDLLPHASYRMLLTESTEGLAFLELGYGVEIHHENLEGRYQSIAPRNGVFEHRLNLTGSFDFSSDASIEFLLSFDLDELRTHAWEGGNGRFRMSF